jgi:hypothetical protein
MKLFINIKDEINPRHWYLLNLGDSINHGNNTYITRVPGGWIYETNNNTTFIPYNSEFLDFIPYDNEDLEFEDEV